jgi:hypothetical protein
MVPSISITKSVAFVAALVATIALCAGAAQAHRLSLVKAHAASVDTAEFVCSKTAGCTDYQVEPCRRLSAHKVRCKGHLTFTDPQTGAAAECTWDDQWSIKADSQTLHWSPRVFDQTFNCV